MKKMIPVLLILATPAAYASISADMAREIIHGVHAKRGFPRSAVKSRPSNPGKVVCTENPYSFPTGDGLDLIAESLQKGANKKDLGVVAGNLEEFWLRNAYENPPFAWQLLILSAFREETDMDKMEVLAIYMLSHFSAESSDSRVIQELRGFLTKCGFSAAGCCKKSCN